MKFTRNFALFLTVSAFVFGSEAQTSFAQIPNEKPQIAKSIVEAKELSIDEKLEAALASKKSETFENPKSSVGFAASSTLLHRVGVQTDQTIPLSLNEAIRTALENNNQIAVARDDVRFQETQLRSLLGIYDGVFSVSPTFTRNSTTGSTATKDFRINSDFTKFVRQGGGSYRVFFDNNRTENAFAQAQVSGSNIGSTGNSAFYSSSTGVTFTQPLFRDFKIDNNRRQIRIQRKRLQQTDADFRRQTIEIINQVQRSYWDLVFALRDQQNRTANLNLARENLRQVEARIEAGAAAPLARAEVGTELANRETDVLLATQQVSLTENTLKTLLLRESNSPQWSQTYVPTDTPIFNTDPINLEDALKDAADNRPELRRLQLQKEINDIDISFFKNQTKPQIDFNSTFSLNGLARGTTNGEIIVPRYTGNEFELGQRINSIIAAQNLGNTITPINLERTDIIPAQSNYLFGGFNRSLLNIFRGDAPNFSVGVTISFPFRNQTAKANLAGARIQEEQIQAQSRQQQQTIIRQVRDAVQAVETSRQRVLTARRARENAEIQLEGERKLFDVGRSTTFLLFQRENALTNARNSEIRAETDYNKAISDLQSATSTTFRVNNIEVDSPMDDQ
jgi:HAE1 family hydrophobic/amphiphilic exporter-1